MKKILLILTVLFSLTVFSQKQTNGKIYIEHPAIDVVNQFNEAYISGDLDKLREYVSNASKENIKVFIAAAGGAAALPGVIAAMTNLPVIGVPIGSSSLRGIDALMSIVQMPPGIPVGCVALDSWGARNSAIYAASILALSDPKINENITKYKNKLKQK